MRTEHYDGPTRAQRRARRAAVADAPVRAATLFGGLIIIASASRITAGASRLGMAGDGWGWLGTAGDRWGPLGTAGVAGDRWGRSVSRIVPIQPRADPADPPTRPTRPTPTRPTPGPDPYPSPNSSALHIVCGNSLQKQRSRGRAFQRQAVSLPNPARDCIFALDDKLFILARLEQPSQKAVAWLGMAGEGWLGMAGDGWGPLGMAGDTGDGWGWWGTIVDASKVRDAGSKPIV